MKESAHLSLELGTEIAGYHIEAPLGRGGMAVVFKARDVRLDRPVALKVLAPELARSPQFRERFLRESRLAASLDHPNIIPVYEAGEANGLLFIAMRLVTGGDLTGVLESRGPLEPAETVTILSQVAAGLDAAHAAGLVHRDVKPDNILIVPSSRSGERPHVYLSDFGLTKRVSSLSGVTTRGEFIATMDYAAPEQIGSRPVDARTDVYGLGCVAYRCLTGTLPFIRDDEAAVLWAHLVERAPLVSTHRPELVPVDEVVARALQKDPDERFATCGEFIDALAGVTPSADSGQPATSRPPVDETTSVRRGPPVLPPPSTPIPAAPAVPVMAAQEANEPPAPRQTGEQQRPAGTGRRSKALLAAAAAAAAVFGLAGAFALTRGDSADGGSKRSLTTVTNAQAAASSPASAAAISDCRSARSAADAALTYGSQVASQIRRHAGLMVGPMRDEVGAGRPALTAGAAAAAKYQLQLTTYKPLSAKCSTNTASPEACTTQLAAADSAVKIAGGTVTALMDHTAVMDRWDAGELTSHEAHHLGKPSQDRGLAAAKNLDRAMTSYQSSTSTC